MTKKRKAVKRRRNGKQTGGKMPYFVDVKKGYQVTKDLIKALKTPIDVPKTKKLVKGYEQQYQHYKRGGGSKSYGNWAISKGYAKKADANCCIM